MQYMMLILLFALFGLSMGALNGSCPETISINPQELPVDYRGWENSTNDIRLIKTERLYIRPQKSRLGSKIKAKGPYKKYKQFWTMYYRNPAVMFSTRSKTGQLLFMGVQDGRVVLVEGEAPTDMVGKKLINFMNADPRVFKYDFAPTVDHKKFILTHPATNSYLRVARSNRVIKLTCNLGNVADVDLEANFDFSPTKATEMELVSNSSAEKK